ncbi:LRR domain containing protein [Trema orientale]|uniref:LRR domain containing protein n=1 Tax=Trema orientale TaxID=63057 RepID=A0A2P5D5U0_TREOI|nr:LRR domain containing protein [Trema orientale]
MAENGVRTHAPPPAQKRVKTTPETQTQTPRLGVDRISTLPDPLIQHILSFLPTFDVVRTSVLSKQWRHIWYSVPTLCFSYSTTDIYGPKTRKEFYKYINNCLKQRKLCGMRRIVDPVITSFKLAMKVRPYGKSVAHRLNKWLASAVESKVKELYLYLESESPSYVHHYHYCLPETVVNSRYLTIMELEGTELSTYTFSLPSLKTLSLTYVLLSDDGLNKLLLGCPSLEKLVLYKACGYCLCNGRFRSLSLKYLEIDKIRYLAVQVEAINLESLVLVDVRCKRVDLSACKAIRNLNLSGDVWFINDRSLEYLISKLPLLENLTLSNCDGLKHVKISSQGLKSFSLNNIYCEVKVTVELAPKLASFRYKGNLKFSISMESPNLLNGHFVLVHGWPPKFDANWYTNLMNFLSNLNCFWNIVHLDVRLPKALMLPKNLRRNCPSPLLNWKHLKVTTNRKPEKESEYLREVLFWIAPSLETLSIN